MFEIAMKGIHQDIALIVSDELVIKDVQSALDLIATVFYEHRCTKIILHKENIPEAFFNLSTRLAGDILQKCVNYRVILAIAGDFSVYTSKSLKDFILESNQGNHCFFVSLVDDALERLERISQ